MCGTSRHKQTEDCPYIMQQMLSNGDIYSHGQQRQNPAERAVTTGQPFGKPSSRSATSFLTLKPTSLCIKQVNIKGKTNHKR